MIEWLVVSLYATQLWWFIGLLREHGEKGDCWGVEVWPFSESQALEIYE